jgi:hypothetical protein
MLLISLSISEMEFHVITCFNIDIDRGVILSGAAWLGREPGDLIRSSNVETVCG